MNNNTTNPNKKRHHHHNKNRNRQRFQPERPSINKVYDSNGPAGRQRGNASTLYEKYTTLARDANLSGDRVLSENFMQFAEHYLRIVNSIQEQMQSAYRDSYRESDNPEESFSDDTHGQQPYLDADNKPENIHNNSSIYSDNSVYQPTENQYSETSHNHDTSKEKPVMRRKIYPYARRKPYEPSHAHHGTDLADNQHNKGDVPANVPFPNGIPKMAEIPLTPVLPEVDDEEKTKPRRVVRRRTVVKTESSESQNSLPDNQENSSLSE